MLPIQGVYEVVIRVEDLERAEGFYRDVLDLELGLRDDERSMSFWRAGGSAGMVVRRHDPGAFPRQHFAFTIRDGEIDKAAELLRARGVEVEGPVRHDWMPARSLYFSDPDGHGLELCAPLEKRA